MKLLQTLLAIIVCISLTSFYKISPKKEILSGTYGVCDCENEKDKTKVIIKLKLNADHTFHYLDNSNGSEKLDMSGSWTLMHDKIILNHSSGKAIYDQWHVDHHKPCIKSRKGMNFRRLCLVKPC